MNKGDIHIAVWFEHIEPFLCAPFSVAFGAYVPSQKSSTCKLYHCLIPSSAASLSATSPIISSNSPSISAVRLPISVVMLCQMPLKKPVAVGWAPEEVVVGISSWPRVDVLSCWCNFSCSSSNMADGRAVGEDVQ